VEEGFAGMVLCVGYYFDRTPLVIREHANKLGFPIIETPPDLLFIEITESVLERIINHQYALLQQSIRRSITIEDPAFHILATAQNGNVDEARRHSIDSGRTTPEVAQRLLDAGIYTQLLERMGPMHVDPMPDLGMNMERYVAPIIVDREIYAYIWIIAGDDPLTELDELAISHGATVAALILFKETAVRKAEEALRGDFLELLLQGQTDTAIFAELSQRLNFHPDRPHQALLISGPSKTGGSAHTLLDNVSEWLRGINVHPLLMWRNDHLVMILENDSPVAGKELAKEIVESLSHPARSLFVGIGGSHQAADDEDGLARLSYEEAREAARIGSAMGMDEGFLAFDELGVLHWLYHMPVEKRMGNAFLKHVGTLASYDVKRGTALVKTLEHYLDNGGSLVDTADALFIHRNTLLHRLERIEKLCPVDLRDPLQRLNLHAAVKGYRLFRNKEE
jgi:purine catabolism regulator